MVNPIQPRTAASNALADLQRQTGRAGQTEEDDQKLALTIAHAADDRKGADIVLLKLGTVSYIADYFVVVTGFSSAQVRAIAGSIEETVETELGRLPLRTEGQLEGSWVLMDYGDVIVHIFMPKEREF